MKKPALWDDPGQGKPRAFLQAANMIGQYPDTKDYDGMIRDYCRCLTGVDDNVGRVLKSLDDQKLADNTAVLYTSDNGFFLGEWQRFDKRFMHEPSIRVPFLLKLPKSKYVWNAGKTLGEMVINPDIAPTVLEIAGGSAVKGMHGRSVVPLVAEHPGDPVPVKWRDAWYYEYFEYPDPSHGVQKHRGVRTERWKLIHYYAPPFGWKDELELYDLEKDPEERVNLANRPAFAGTVKELQAKLTALRTELGATDGK